MLKVDAHSVLKGITVGQAMRRQVIALAATQTVGQSIRMMIRNKVNAVLITDNDTPLGVVSKTDLLGAFYAELPMETALSDVAGSQPIACFPDDPLEAALEIMEAAGVHRLYIIGASRRHVIGVVAYSDIVGLLYRHCRNCERSIAKKRAERSQSDSLLRLTVREVMTRQVHACRKSDQLFTAIEILSGHHMGAVLVEDENRLPAGVISKTDLILAYHHGVSPQTESHEIMNTPVHSVSADEVLHAALQQMMIQQVQRLFVHRDTATPDQIIGVLSLSDSARFRSGTCRACTAARILER